MAKKKTNAKPRKSAKVADFAADDPLAMKGIWDSILKSLFDNINFDLTKIDREKLKHGIRDFGDALKPAASMPFDVDDRLIDGAVNVLFNLLDSVNADGEGDDEVIVMGAKNYTKRDATAYMKKFDNVDERCRKMLEKYPQTIETLERLSPPNQEKVMASPFLLNLLVIFGPMILQWIIDRLGK
jgi:hypothetical protein